MGDLTDLAATLHGLAEASVDFPAECQDRLYELLPAIATVLERGAAAIEAGDIKAEPVEGAGA